MEKMEVGERFKYLRMMKERYHQADRGGKSLLLDEMERMTGLQRKHLIARMNGPGPYRRKGQGGRRRVYDEAVDQVIGLIWDTHDWICAERLQPTLVQTATKLVACAELEVSDEVLQKLGCISLSSVQRALCRIRPQREGRLPQARRGRRPEIGVEPLVPLRVIPWDEPDPGHFEVDLVQHGPAEEKVVYTLQCIDVLTGWSERFAILGNGYNVMWPVFPDFVAHGPIPVREVHCDNGPEFINQAI